KRTNRGRMMDRNRELVPDNWSLVRERELTTGLCSEGWYSEHLGVCRRTELLGRSVHMKRVLLSPRTVCCEDTKTACYLLV
ncbi:MAG: hypothetical protein LGB06_08425, partial [Sulfurovum sp.]|nr:hypothetical protein [Sulfurovum sp.]